MIGAVVLAAGRSSRMGRPKQLLPYRGSSLLRLTTRSALDAGCRPVLVVLGHDAIRIREELVGHPVDVVIHDRWMEGLASSLRAGVEALRAREPQVTAALLLACDQPLISADVVRRILNAFDGRESRIVASAYSGTVGVPALFDRSLFDRLVSLEGDCGAKTLLLDAGDDLVRVPWPEGAVEINRPEEYRRLLDGERRESSREARSPRKRRRNP